MSLKPQPGNNKNVEKEGHATKLDKNLQVFNYKEEQNQRGKTGL